MLRPMAGYVRAEQRRQLAREAALRVLSRGEVGPEEVALRHVAQEMDVPLSTLTYAYPSTGLLLDDLADESNRALWSSLGADVGDGGLRTELEAAARQFAVDVLGDPARRALMLWQIQALARNEWTRAEISVERATDLVDVIADRAGEHYRVPHQVLAQLILAYTFGQLVQWLATRDQQAYWSTLLAGIDGAVLLADPRPAGEPHPGPTPRDYEGVVFPRSRTRSSTRRRRARGRGSSRPAAPTPERLP
jgi:AcrR family transcriptional regulator